MPPREPDQIPLQTPTPRRTITPPGTPGGFTPNPGHPDHVVALRTYSTDLAEAMRKNDGSVVQIALMEDARRRQDAKAVNPTSKKNLTFIILGIIFIIIAGGAIGFAIYKTRTPDPVIPEKPTLPPALVQSDEVALLDTTGKPAVEIVRALRAVVDAGNARTGTVKNIIPVTVSGTTKLPLGSAQFLSAIVAHTSSAFSRTLTNALMLGTYEYDTPHLFIVLSSTAHDYMYTGMLEWEPKMLGDLGPLFGLDITSDQIRSSLGFPFQNSIVENRDVRAIYDTQNNLLILYSFLDQNTVVITHDAKTLIETVRRFGK